MWREVPLFKPENANNVQTTRLFCLRVCRPIGQDLPYTWRKDCPILGIHVVTDNGINGFKLCVSYALLSQRRSVMSTKEPAVSRFAAWDWCCINVRRGRDLLYARR